MVTDCGRPPTAPAVANCHIMIEGAVVTQANRRVKDDAAEMMNPETLPYGTTRWDGNASRNLNEPLTKKTQRLGRDSVSVTPIKKTGSSAKSVGKLRYW